MKRILILTDSLGCPREEYGAEFTWVEKILCDDDFCRAAVTYTYCRYGLSSKDIPFGWIQLLQPDIIICEIGLVDACRNALKDSEIAFFGRMKWIGKLVHRYASKNHYLLTKKREIHSADKGVYVACIQKLAGMAREAFFFVETFPPGDYLIERTFHVKEDIEAYNNIVYNSVKGVRAIRPSLLCDVERYILKSDGQHLTIEGHEMVYRHVKEAVKPLLGQMQ